LLIHGSNSYPELPLGSDDVRSLASPEAAWRSYDNADLYWNRRPKRQELELYPFEVQMDAYS
jgi:hypothetical protein